MIDPHVLFNGKHIAFKLGALNSDDAHVKATARDSLFLHMSRRKVRKSDAEENSFAGYCTQNGRLVKESKIHFPRSQWVFLLELCNRENILLRFLRKQIHTSVLFQLKIMNLFLFPTQRLSIQYLKT